MYIDEWIDRSREITTKREREKERKRDEERRRATG